MVLLSNRLSIALLKQVAVPVLRPASTKTSPSGKAMQVMLAPWRCEAMTTEAETGVSEISSTRQASMSGSVADPSDASDLAISGTSEGPR
jgi:hypothetical protein